MLDQSIPQHADYLNKMLRFISDEDFESALRIRDQFLPQTLYIFGGFECCKIESIKNNQIWFSNPNQFNDVYDSAINLLPNEILGDDVTMDILRYAVKMTLISEEQIQTQLQKDNPLSFERRRYQDVGSDTLYRRMHDNVFDLINKKRWEKSEQERSKILVRCFTENNQSQLMWGHYGDRSQGYALGYDVSKIPEGLRSRLFPVVYKKRFDEFHLSNVASSLVKSQDWRYEQEWRIVIDNTDNHQRGALIPVDALSVINMGVRITPEHQKLICEDIAGYKNADENPRLLVQRGILLPGAFEVGFERLAPYAYFNPE